MPALEWTKFCAWAGLMVAAVTTRASTWQFLSDPGSAVVVVRLIKELGALAQASGIELTDQSVLPVASVCAADEAQAVRLMAHLGGEFRVLADPHRMSSLQDLEAGRRLEVEETLGDAHRRAVASGLTLPLLDAFYRLTAGIDRLSSAGGLPP